jgi:hypothetical protein
MVRDHRSPESSSRSACVWRLVLALALVPLAGCVARLGASPEEERLAGVLAQQPPGEPPKVAEGQRSPIKGDYYLHIAGLVECGGFLRKTQTSYVETWATRPGRDGPRVEIKDLELRISYLDGLFDGVVVKKEIGTAEGLRASDVVRGNFSSSPCGCVRFLATGKIPPRNDGIGTRLKVCPSS